MRVTKRPLLPTNRSRDPERPRAVGRPNTFFERVTGTGARPGAFEDFLTNVTPEAMKRLVKRMAEGASRFDFGGIAPFVRTLAPQERRVLFDTALETLAPSELAGFERNVGTEGLRLLAIGGLDTEPTLLTERFGANVTTRVAELYASGAHAAPRGVEDCAFLFGRGLFGNQVPGYLAVNRDALSGWVPKRQRQLLRYDTAADSTDNASRIAEQVYAAVSRGYRPVLFGHSKFGLDLRRAFAAYPDLKKQVAGVVFVQPVSTAAVMNRIRGLPYLGDAASNLSWAVFGSNGAVDDLGTTGARPHGRRVEPWPGDEVPTVIVASSSDERSWLRPVVRQLAQVGVSSDGALALAEQVGFAGAAVAVFPNGGDHFQLVVDSEAIVGRRMEPKALTRAAVTALFEQAEAMKTKRLLALRAR